MQLKFCQFSPQCILANLKLQVHVKTTTVINYFFNLELTDPCADL